MTTPDPVTDVWELLWTAACDYRDANPTAAFAVSRLIDALMPTVTAYGEERAAKAWDDGYATGWRETEEQPYSDHPAHATWRPSDNPYRARVEIKAE